MVYNNINYNCIVLKYWTNIISIFVKSGRYLITTNNL